MGKAAEERKQAILDLLRNSQIGMSIKNIATELDYSRNTVSKYLRILAEQGKVFDRELGQYSIWLHADAKLYYDKQKARGQKFALETYKYFLKYLKVHYPDLEREGNKIGKFIGENMNLEDLISPDLLIFDGKKDDLRAISKYIMDLLDNTYLSMDTYEFEKPIINEDTKNIYLRMKGSQFVETPLNFRMLCGVLQNKIKQYKGFLGFSAKFEIQDVDSREGIVDVRVKIENGD